MNGLPSALAWAIVHTPESKTAHVYQMWVSPQARGKGVARALMNHIVSWADDARLDKIELAVTTDNTAAVALYRSCGFVPHGIQEELRPGSALKAQAMTLRLRGDPG